MKEERGSLAAEVVILLPCFMMLLLLVVYAGRMTLTATQIQHVAETAARAASRESLQNAQRQAMASAQREIQRQDIECRSGDRDVFSPYGRSGSTSYPIFTSSWVVIVGY